MSKNNNPKAWRFYRSSLPTIVWDRDGDCVLADFSEGHFTTDKPEIANRLIKEGYIEIDLDATSPPPGIVVNQASVSIDGDVPVVSSAITDPTIIENRIRMKERKIGGSTSQPEAPTVRKEKEVTRLKRRRSK